VPVATTVADEIEGFWLKDENEFGPAQLYEIVPVPVAEAVKFNVLPAQMGLLLPDAVMLGPAIGVPLQPQLGAVPVYTSFTVQALLSLHGVPGRAVPPLTPRQSTEHGPPEVGVDRMDPVRGSIRNA